MVSLRGGESRSVLRQSFGRVLGASDSLVLRSYAVVAALVGLLLVAVVVLALPQWVAQTAGHSTVNMAARALLPLVGLALLAPLVAPVLFASANRRAGTATRRGDALLGLAGYAFVASIYVALLISAPVDYQNDPPAALAPAIEWLYATAPIYGILPPILAAALIAVVQRAVR